MISAVGILVRKEFAELRRDRRVLLLSIVVPVLLYPLVLGLVHRSEAQHREQTRSEPLSIVITGGPKRLESAILEDSLLRAIRPGVADSLNAWIGTGRVDAWVQLPTRAEVEAGRPTVRVHHLATRDRSREALRRIRLQVERANADERQARWRQAGGAGWLDHALTVQSHDVATAAEGAGARAARLLVYMLLMTLFLGGSAFSTDMVAGEKERGTLETLFLLPADRRAIATAKLLVVGAGTTLTGLLSLLSLAASYRLGWLGATEGEAGVLSPGTMLWLAALLIPLALLMAAVLLAISAKARSLKEAQQHTLPVLLVVFLPALLSMSQAVELNALVALLPIANVAFVMRDVLLGTPPSPIMLTVVLSTLGWTALVTVWVGNVLSREETVLGFDPEPVFARSDSGRRRALFVAMALSVLAYFYGGQWLQSRDLQWGLLLSLWVVLPGLAVASLAFVGRPAPLSALLSLRAPRPVALLGALLLGWGSLLPVAGLLGRVQQSVLPMPTEMFGPLELALQSWPTWKLFALAALSPAICEELLFRGVFLGLLRRWCSLRQAVLLSALFFALIHLSVFRLAPTFVLGVVLAWIVVRTGSLWSASLYHVVYNGSLLLGERWAREHELPLEPFGPVAVGLSAALLVAGALLLRSRNACAPGGT